MLTDKQLEERKGYITGSDVSAILGLNKYKTAFDVWREKLGLVEPEDISEKPAVKAGNMLEDAVRKWFEKDTGLKVTMPDGLLVHPKHHFMAGNIDGYIEAENAIFEAKTSGRTDGWGENGDNTMPPNYLCQVAHYCEVTGASKAYVAVLFKGVDFRVYTYEPDKKFVDILIEREREFWEHNILKEIPPDLTTIDDVNNMFPKTVDAEHVLSEQALSDLRVYRYYNERIKAMTKDLDEIKTRLALEVKDKGVLVDSDRNILGTFKAQQRTSIDKATAKQENPELFSSYEDTEKALKEQYPKTTTFRTLKLKEPSGE